MGKNKRKRTAEEQISFWRQSLVVASVCINVVGQGAVIGFPAILIPSLRKGSFNITPEQESWIASIIGFAQIVGNIVMVPTMEMIGRQKSHIISVFPIFIGWYMPLLFENYTVLIIARFLQGVSLGMLIPLASVIVAESSEPRYRGAFLVGLSVSYSAGALLVQGVGIIVSWQYTALICSFTNFISLIIIFYCPETPSWLVSKGRIAECKENFFWLRGSSLKEIDELEQLVSGQMNQNVDSSESKASRFLNYLKSTYKKPEFYKPMIIMIHLQVMLQFAGLYVLSSYTIDIIHQLVGPNTNANFWMVFLNIERLASNIVAVLFMRNFKRRVVLYSTGIMGILAYISKGVYLLATEGGIVKYEWIPLLILCLYMFSLSVGLNAIPFTIAGEIFPLKYRGLGGGISGLIGSLNFFIAVECFPILTGSVGLSWTYFLYASVVGYCLIVLWFRLPETKDKTLQEIEDGFRGNVTCGENKEFEEPFRKEENDPIEGRS